MTPSYDPETHTQNPAVGSTGSRGSVPAPSSQPPLPSRIFPVAQQLCLRTHRSVTPRSKDLPPGLTQPSWGDPCPQWGVHGKAASLAWPGSSGWDSAVCSPGRELWVKDSLGSKRDLCRSWRGVFVSEQGSLSLADCSHSLDRWRKGIAW